MTAKTYYTATIEVLVECKDEAEACDAVAEALRPLLRKHATGETAWIGWQYAQLPEPLTEADALLMFSEFAEDSAAEGEGEDGPDLSGAELWADGARGVYIPQFFAQGVQRQHVSGVSDEDFAVLTAGPEHELYWDTWADVLDNAVLTSPINGSRWSLYQDGDLWIVPMKEPEDFKGWCDWVSGGKHDKPSEWPDRDTLAEQIDKAHRRGAISDEMTRKLADYFGLRIIR